MFYHLTIGSLKGVKQLYGIEYLGQELLEEACRMRASDVHIVPKEKEASVSFRVDSDLIQQRTIDKKAASGSLPILNFYRPWISEKNGDRKMGR